MTPNHIVYTYRLVPSSDVIKGVASFHGCVKIHRDQPDIIQRERHLEMHSSKCDVFIQSELNKSNRKGERKGVMVSWDGEHEENEVV